MSLPVVAIVGRPNVGKSSLFNCLSGRRISIVDPTAGVTRDRVTFPMKTDGRDWEMMDTGGIGIEDADNLTAEVESQIDQAIQLADVLLFVVDMRSGPTPLDEEISRRLRHVSKPVILVGNKCDTPRQETHADEFFSLGRGRPLPVSAAHRRGRDALLAAIMRALPENTDEPLREPDLKLAIVGRRNVGKSTFINSLAKAERMIVSEVAGTTRDSVDVRFERDGKAIVAIDTAGVRKKKSLASDVEFYSLHRAQRSIRRADVALMFLDPRERISHVDKAVTEYILTQYKPAIFVINKWDLAKSQIATETFGEYVRKILPMLDFVPIAFITAKNGKNVYAVLNLAQNLHKQASARVGTGDLNRVVRQAVELRPPPLRQNRRPKVYYATQVAANPPTIVLFTNGPKLFDDPYRRYLLNTLHEQLPFHEVPIKLYFRAKQRDGTADQTEKEATKPKSRERTKQPAAKPARRPRTGGKPKRGESGLWRDL